MIHLTGVLLAGGQSRRFGSPKSFALLKGIPFYKYSIRAMQPTCHEILIITNDHLKHRFNNVDQQVEIVTDNDTIQGQGPLAGILTAMEYKESSWYFILPTDVPYIEAWVINRLIAEIDEKSQVIIPTVQGRDQPLIGLYHCSVKDTIKSTLQHGKRSMQSLFETITVKKVIIDEEGPFRNINKREDLSSNQ